MSGLINLILVFFANFGFIFIKAFQQQNVIHGNWWWVLPTSFTMGLFEVYVLAYIAATGFSLPLVTAVGLGGGLGCISSMWIHRRLNGKAQSKIRPSAER